MSEKDERADRLPQRRGRQEKRRRAQPDKSLFGRRIISDIEAVEIENAGKPLDRLLRNFMFRRAKLANHRRGDEADQKTEDRKHNKQFDQREATLAFALRSAPMPGCGKNLCRN